jgi:hypothetical protein
VVHVRHRDRLSRDCRTSCAQTCYRCFASRSDREHGHWCEEHSKCRATEVSGRCLCEKLMQCPKHSLSNGRASRGKQWLCMCGCVLFASCAILSKETGVTVLMLCASYDVLTHLGKKRSSLVDIFTEVSSPPFLSYFPCRGTCTNLVVFARLPKQGESQVILGVVRFHQHL